MMISLMEKDTDKINEIETNTVVYSIQNASISEVSLLKNNEYIITWKNKKYDLTLYQFANFAKFIFQT